MEVQTQAKGQALKNTGSPLASPKTRARRTRNKTVASSSPSRHLADEVADEDAVDSSAEVISQVLSPLAASSSRSSGGNIPTGTKQRRATASAPNSSAALMNLVNTAPTPAPSPALPNGSPSPTRRILGFPRSPQPKRKKSLPSLASSSIAPDEKWLGEVDEDLLEEDDTSFSPRVDDDGEENWDFLRIKRNEDVGKHLLHERSFSSPVWCNVCKRKIKAKSKSKGKQSQAKMCSVCRYVTHFECEAGAACNCPSTFSVYPLPSASPEEVRRVPHAWIEGNHPSSSCLFCTKEVSGRDMVGSRCYWCLGVAHNECRDQNAGVVCDFGKLRTLKLPPYAIYQTGKEEPELAWQLEPSYLSGTDCKPLLVFINRMSGGQQGPGVIQRLSYLLNPNQIIDIRQGGPAVGLNLFMPLIEKANGFRILICGGDGTVNWVCTALAKIQFPSEESMPQLGLLPLGTGNDLCGFLGWGTGYTGGDLYKIIKRMNEAVPIKLDRWKVRIMETAILKGSKIISFKKRHTPGSRAQVSASAAPSVTPVGATTPGGASSSVDLAAANSLLRSAPPKMPNRQPRLGSSQSSTSLTPRSKISGAASPPTSPPPQRRPHSPQLPARRLEFPPDDSEAEAGNGARTQPQPVRPKLSATGDSWMDGRRAVDGEPLATSPSRTVLIGTSPRRGHASPRKPLPVLPRSASTMAAVSVHSITHDPIAAAAQPVLPPLPSVTPTTVPTSPPSPATVARHEAQRQASPAAERREMHFEESDENAVDEVHLRGRALQYDVTTASVADSAPGADENDQNGNGNDKSPVVVVNKSWSDESKAVSDWFDQQRSNDADDDVDDSARNDHAGASNDDDVNDVNDKKGLAKMKKVQEDKDSDHDEDNDDDDDEEDEDEDEEEEEAPTQPPSNPEDTESETVSLKSFHHSFSLGVDAKISMAFHLAREANPDAFTSRGMNKFKYFTQGINSILEGGCKNLSQGIEFIAIDDTVIHGDELPSSIESIVFSNIPAYADGTDLWGSARPFENMKPQKVDDKIIEVVAHKGSIHLIQIKAGVSKSISLGQGRKVKLQTKAILPMQLDGEPWLQGPALIEIEHFSQVKMLVPVKKKLRLTSEGKCDE